MLQLLRIKNFAIIDQLELEFSKGFNAITGETGAGKSIILDAIALILGNRANTDIIRTGSDEASVEALFEIKNSDPLIEKLEEFGIDTAGSELLVRRTVHRNGKSKIYLNGTLTTLSQLADICENLVELCSQHEHQSLGKSVFQLELLDRYGGLLEKRKTLKDKYLALKQLEVELISLKGGTEGAARTEDFLKFQIAEIESFDAKDGEEEELQSERKRMMNATHLMDHVAVATSMIDGGEEDATTLIGRALNRISKAMEYDDGLEPAFAALQRANAELSEAASELATYAQKLEIDPDRIEEVENRLVKWSHMKKKYGTNADELNEVLQKLLNELDGLENRQANIKKIEAEILIAKTEYDKNAADLSKKRKVVAKTLSSTIQTELSELSMPNTKFEIEFSTNEPTTDGVDRIQFLFSPNPGESLKPVSKIASGGELSRVMLSIRRTIADQGGIGVYLFDEIDAGIGGQTASVVGKKLQSVSKHNQIICITHLPQVAAYSNAHFHVSKKITDGRTSSEIIPLTGTKRVDEIARMLGGLNVTEKSRAHAKDLLKEATTSVL